MAGRGRDTAAATVLLAEETGRCSREFGSGDRLPSAKRAKLCWGHARICLGCATDRTAQEFGRTPGRHSVHGPFGRVQDMALSLYGAERYVCRKPDRQPAVWGNGR